GLARLLRAGGRRRVRRVAGGAGARTATVRRDRPAARVLCDGAREAREPRGERAAAAHGRRPGPGARRAPRGPVPRRPQRPGALDPGPGAAPPPGRAAAEAGDRGLLPGTAVRVRGPSRVPAAAARLPCAPSGGGLSGLARRGPAGGTRRGGPVVSAA